MKSSVQAYAIQGLIKYHGLRNPKLRIPFHDSISVCMKALPTLTTVEPQEGLSKDRIKLNGHAPTKNELSRIEAVTSPLKNLTGRKSALRIESRNPNVNGKGLGFSASGFAALGFATSKALGLEIDEQKLSEIVRLGAGSAARSLVGGFSIWYANRKGRSFAEQLAPPNAIDFRTIIVPISSKIKTDTAHVDVLTSPLYKARLEYLNGVLNKMRRAIARRDANEVCRLAELDTLSLHAITMTGKDETVLFSPLSIEIMEEVRCLREDEGVPVWYSLDTGPSVFVNTTSSAAPKVQKRIRELSDISFTSEPGGEAHAVSRHLF
jgi:phosphomevalonate decarboxylase